MDVDLPTSIALLPTVHVQGNVPPPVPLLDAPALRYIVASGASIQDLGVRDGLRTVVARSGAEFMILAVVPSGEAVVAGIPADLSVARLREIAGTGIADLGDRHGLRGLLVRNGDAFQVFYATPNGERVIPGVMWDAAGKNLTREQASSIEGAIPTVTIDNIPSTATPVTPPSPDRVAAAVPSARALAIAERTSAGSVGNPSAPHIWMFVDPQCGYSVQAMQRFQPLVARGKVRVSVVPVAILDHQNAGRSTADSLAMLTRPAEQMVQAWSRGDLSDPIAPEAATKLQGNMEAARSIGLRGTPTLLWRRADGSEGRQDGMAVRSRRPRRFNAGGLSVTIDLGPGLRDTTKERRRRNWVLAGPRWTLHRFSEAAGARDIYGGARLIRQLAAVLGRGQPGGAGLVADESGQLDTRATAFVMGVSEGELHRIWAIRREHSARMAWGYFLAGWGFLALWAWQAMDAPWTQARIWAAVQFLPFCAAFFLLAFCNAWQNWQLRTGQLGSAGDYLRTTEPFWPSAD